MNLDILVMKMQFPDRVDYFSRNELYDVHMHSQTNGAISSAIAERVIPDIRNTVSSLSSGNSDTESGSSSNNQERNDGTTGFKTKITKNDCRSAFDLSNTEDLSPYMVTGATDNQRQFSEFMTARIR